MGNKLFISIQKQAATDYDLILIIFCRPLILILRHYLSLNLSSFAQFFPVFLNSSNREQLPLNVRFCAAKSTPEKHPP